MYIYKYMCRFISQDVGKKRFVSESELVLITLCHRGPRLSPSIVHYEADDRHG